LKVAPRPARRRGTGARRCGSGIGASAGSCGFIAAILRRAANPPRIRHPTFDIPSTVACALAVEHSLLPPSPRWWWRAGPARRCRVLASRLPRRRNAQTDAPGIAAFHEGMAVLGWVHGKDYTLETWYAENVATRLTVLAATVIATRPDVILTTAESPAARADQPDEDSRRVRHRTRSPSRRSCEEPAAPGGTATVLVTFAPELSAKRVQLLREAFPKTSHVAALYAKDDPVGIVQVSEIERAARDSACGSRRSASVAPPTSSRHSRKAKKLESMASSSRAGHDIDEPQGDRRCGGRRPRAGDLSFRPLSARRRALELRNPAHRELPPAAANVDKILKGAAARRACDRAEPTQVDLVVNQKAARAQGLSISPSLLVRADMVIQ
jgi:putative ABC transport system substrate-binding protein